MKLMKWPVPARLSLVYYTNIPDMLMLAVFFKGMDGVTYFILCSCFLHVILCITCFLFVIVFVCLFVCRYVCARCIWNCLNAQCKCISEGCTVCLKRKTNKQTNKQAKKLHTHSIDQNSTEQSINSGICCSKISKIALQNLNTIILILTEVCFVN